MKSGHPPAVPAPYTHSQRQNAFSGTSNVMMGSDHTTIPPSPGVPVPGFEALTMGTTSKRDLPSRNRKNKGKGNARTGAGVKKQVKKRSDDSMAKLVDAGFIEKVGTSDQRPFRFMDLPGGKCLVSD